MVWAYFGTEIRTCKFKRKWDRSETKLKLKMIIGKTNRFTVEAKEGVV